METAHFMMVDKSDVTVLIKQHILKFYSIDSTTFDVIFSLRTLYTWWLIPVVDNLRIILFLLA